MEGAWGRELEPVLALEEASIVYEYVRDVTKLFTRLLVVGTDTEMTCVLRVSVEVEDVREKVVGGTIGLAGACGCKHDLDLGLRVVHPTHHGMREVLRSE